MSGIRQAFGRNVGMEVGWIASLLTLPRRSARRGRVRQQAADPFAAIDAFAVRPFHEALR